MVNYLSVENISKAFADKQLFENLSFGIAEGQKIALVGINGSGKSTLLKILGGKESPDTGQVSMRKGIRMAYLDQDPQYDPNLTVGEVVFSTDHPALNVIQEYERLLTLSDPDSKTQERIQELTDKITELDAWDYEVRIQQILGKLHVHFLDTPMGQLSGGQRKRVALAQALIEDPDLMIMDEPTNHLDLESIEWLEKFLSTSKQSLILVTHDRYFLDGVTNEILELDQHRLFNYQGNYAYFLEKKAEREEVYTQTVEKARSLYARELEWLRRSPKARGTKSKSRISSAGELKQKTFDNRDHRDLLMGVKGRRIGGQVLEIKNLRKSYGDLSIVDNFTYTFKRRDRIGIIGPNGVGKSTFLNLILGLEQPDSGKIRMGETIVPGYYHQSGLKFKDNQRVIEVVTEAAEEVELSKSQRVSAAQLLEHFLFPRFMHHYMVETLSGGERRRLHLLRILMTNPNFLVLDEPTNDLDLVTLRKLEEFLSEWEGCMVIVTHDRYFMDRLVDHTFVFEGQGFVRDYPGSYSQYREWAEQQEKEKEEAEAKAAAATTQAAKEKPKNNRTRKLSYKEQREYDSLEEEIDTLEQRKTELTGKINGGSEDYNELMDWSKELEKLEEDIDEKSMRWLELAEIIEGT